MGWRCTIQSNYKCLLAFNKSQKNPTSKGKKKPSKDKKRKKQPQKEKKNLKKY